MDGLPVSLLETSSNELSAMDTSQTLHKYISMLRKARKGILLHSSPFSPLHSSLSYLVTHKKEFANI